MKISLCKNKQILSKCPLEKFEYQIDTYIGCEHNCYYCYALNQAETDWSEEISIHDNISGRLAEDLHGITPQTIYTGYKTDPYQPVEAEYFQTQNVLKILSKKGFSASILTKSDLVTRDIDLLGKMNDSAVSISVAFTDNKTRKMFEANTIDTERRIEALRILKKAGIRTGALICPVIPYVTDTLLLLDMLLPYTDVIWIYRLSINNRLEKSWLNIESILKNHFSDRYNLIEAAIFSDDDIYWLELKEKLLLLKKTNQLNLNIHI